MKKRRITAFVSAACLCLTPISMPPVSAADAVTEDKDIVADQENNALKVKLKVDDTLVPSDSDINIYTEIVGEIPSDAWITIVSSDVPHTEEDGDAHNCDWMWLKDIKDGVAVLHLPREIGKYDIRVYDGDNAYTAQEIACQPLDIVYAPNLKVDLSIEKEIVKADADLDIKVDISGYVPNDAWISFIPSDVPHTEEDGDAHNGDWMRLKDIKDGIATLHTPPTRGKYDIRVYDGDEARLASEVACITVTLSGAPYLTVELSVDNPEVKPDEDMNICTKINGDIPDDAWITFVPSDIPHTEKDSDDHNGNWMRLKDIKDGIAVLRTPKDTGKYDIRVFNCENPEIAEEIAYLPLLITLTPNEVTTTTSSSTTTTTPKATTTTTTAKTTTTTSKPTTTTTAKTTTTTSRPTTTTTTKATTTTSKPTTTTTAKTTTTTSKPTTTTTTKATTTTSKPTTTTTTKVTTSKPTTTTSEAITTTTITTQDESELNVKIKVDNTVIRSDSDVNVYTEIKGKIPSDAWIAFVPSDIPHTEGDSDKHDINSMWLKDIKDGVAVLHSPRAIGKYDIRVFDGDSAKTAKEIAYLPIDLEYAPDLKVNLSVEREIVKSNADLDIKVDISGYIPDDAWITFVPSDIPHTEKDGDDHNGNWMRLKDIKDGVATIHTPAARGKYDIRAYNGDDARLASEVAYLTVTLSYAPYLTVELSVDNPEVKPNEKMNIYTEINGDIPDDAWITFVPSDIPHTEKDSDDHNGNWMRLKDIKDGVAVLKTPSETGKYDIRVLNGENSALAEEIAYLPILVTTEPVINDKKLGDINNDGEINLKDVVLLRRYIAGGWGVELDEKDADVNCDNSVDLKDVVILRRYIAGGWGVKLGKN